MPSKTTKGASKPHNRTSSASSTGKLNINAAFARNKSAEKIKRNVSDIHVALPRQPPSPPPSKRAPAMHVEIGAAGAGDDDEWVSSESGAATPADYEEEDVPPSAEEEEEIIPSTTPRGDPPAPPPPARRPRPQSLMDLPRVDTLPKFTTAHPEDAQSPDSLLFHHTHHHHHHHHRHRRPPSAQSARPHPLIRARSYAPSPATPTLALTADPAQLRASASTAPSPTAHGTHYVHTPLASSPSPSASEQHYFAHHRLTRQPSRSSVTSVATLPLPARAPSSAASTTHINGERHRALSHAHAHTPSAALSSLAAATHPHAHAPSRPPSPLFTSAFPPVNPREEQRHVMIPPPLVPPHASATAHRNPVLEALLRVAEAKQRAGR